MHARTMRLALTGVLFLVTTMLLTAQERDRAKVPDSFKWNLADVYPDQQAWLDDLYEAVRASDEAYYEDTVSLLCLLALTGTFWDPTKLPGVKITPDPIANVRKLRSGSVFSPEFGGMTANVEF